ncbi:hypothetical protein UFOVP237_38 [uncultured Caudovirales phage]|uniref:Uncharacterized protein n=1 Tax=uncultured Caudovirales phage TaxID=2100421 RepID=A0A6J7WPG1_9CAUD|nr:hypothetical protein UFOVP237_38 [uncultured Caudovirales phage]
MLIPKIHMNGTSGAELLQQACDVMAALNDTLEAMRKATPNGRDYYQQGEAAAKEARDQFSNLYRTIEDVRLEFEVLAMGIDAQMGV